MRKENGMDRDRSRGSLIGITLFVMILMASCSDGGVAGPSTGPDGGGASVSVPPVHILDDCPELPCQGSLEPGEYRWEYRSTPNEPTITFTIPSPGWTWYYSGGFRIVADDFATVEGLYIPDGIYFLRDPTIAARDCEESSEPGVGRSVSDLVAWLENAPGLIVSEPAPVTVGGLEGMQLDIELDPAWERTYFFNEKLPTVPLLFSGAEFGGYHWAIVPEQSLRWFILDSQDGALIVAMEDDPGGFPQNELFQTGGRIVDSLEFSWT